MNANLLSCWILQDSLLTGTAPCGTSVRVGRQFPCRSNMRTYFANSVHTRVSGTAETNIKVYYAEIAARGG